MEGSQALLQIFRPENVDSQDYPFIGPWDGVEIYLMESEDMASTLAEFLQDAHPSWRFMVSTAHPWKGEEISNGN